MKFKFIYILAMAAFAYLVLSSRSSGAANAGIGGRTNAPSEGLCSDCHGGGAAPSLSIQLLDAGNPVTSYTAGQSYTLRVTVGGGTRYGMQAVALNSSNTNTGTLSAPSANGRISAASGRSYLEHNNTSTSGVFTATWVAPTSGTGNVTIYAAGLNANGTGNTLGDGTSSTQLVITETVATSINYANSYCANASNPSPTLTGTTGGVFSSTAGLVFVSNSTGQINLAASTPGTYTITYTYNGGTNTTTDIVTITAQDVASFNYSASSYCQNAGTNPSPTLTSPNGGSFSATPAGLFFVNANTGQINLSGSTPGTYIIRFVSGGTCPTTVTQNVSITAANSSAFSYSGNSFCEGSSNSLMPNITGTTGGVFSAQVGLLINSSTGQINITNSLAGNYAITYTSPSPCPSSSVFNLSITPRPSATISYPSATVCQNVGLINVNLQGATGGTYTALAGLDINSSTGTINASNSLIGSYVVNYQTAACGVLASTSVQILANDAATISYPSASYCQSQSNPSPTVTGTAGGSFSSVQGGIVLNSSTGEINLAASSLGTFNIIYTSNGNCPVSDTAQVSILTNGNASFNYGMDTFCQNSQSIISPTITGISGGTFNNSTNNNLVINPNTGEIEISSTPVGTYEAVYVVGGACPATDTVNLTIVAGDTVAFYYDSLNANNSEFFNGVWYFCDYGIDAAIITAGQGGRFETRLLNNTVFNSPNFLDSLTGQFNFGADVFPDTNGLVIIEFLYISDGICPDTANQIITFRAGPCGAVGKLDLTNYQLFPNPVQNTVAIQNRDYLGEMRVILYNAFGQVVDSRDINFNGRADYEMGNFPAGLYWIEIQQADGRSGSYKLLKE